MPEQLQEWKPQSEDIPEWKPNKEPSLLEKAWKVATTEPSKIKEFTSSIEDYLTDPRHQIMTERGDNSVHDEVANQLSRFRGGIAGSLKAGIDLFSTPLNAAFAAAGLGEAAAAKNELIPLARGLRRGVQALSAPVAVHGATQLFGKDKTLSERGMGAAELAGGLVGALHGAPELKTGEVVPDEAAPITDESRLLGPAKTYVSPKGEAYAGELPIRRSQEVPYRASEPTNLGVSDRAKAADIALDESKNTKYNSSFINRSGWEEFGPKPEENLPIRQEQRISPSELPPELVKPGEEDLFNAPRKTLATDVQDTIYENAKNKLGGLQKEEETALEPTKPSFINPFEPSEEPSAARTEGGKLAIGADIRSLGKVLGTSLYKGDIAPIATKELLQNSVDAVRHLGDQGNIDVELNHADKSISVRDNGKGLTKQELETVFTDLGASGKRDESEASGGFGLAKASFLLGSKRVEVTSIAKDPKTGKLLESKFEGTPDDLMSGVDVHQREVPSSIGTGTHVKVFVDNLSYYPEEFVKKMASSSHGLRSNIKLSNDYLPGNRPNKILVDMETLPKAEGKVLTTLENPSAKTSLIIPKSAENRTSSYMRLNLSNNGMYQGGKTMYFAQEVPNVPSEVTVDIQPKVPEGHADYPFTANREELRGTVDADVQKYIKDNIVNPSFEARRAEIKKLYESMPEIKVGQGEFPNTFGRKIVVYDPKGQITPKEMNTMINSPSFKSLANDIGGILDEILKTAPKMAQELEKVGIIFQDGLHGIRIPNPGTDKAAILINPFQIISTDSPDVASASLLHTMLHEAAHLDVGAHNESFTIRLGDIYGKFGARRTVEAQDQILKSIADQNTGLYYPEIQKLLQIYKDSRGREGTTEDLLSGTGIKQAARGKGSEGVPPNDKPNGTRASTVQAAIDKLFSALGSASESRVQQDIINKAERAQRFAKSASVTAEGVAGMKQKIAAMRGEFEKADANRLKLTRAETDSLMTAITRARITEPEKIRGGIAMFKLINGEVPQRNELSLLNDVFGNNFADKIMQLHRGIGSVGLNIAKAANTMKSMENAISLAAPLRHGAGMVLRKEFYPAFVEMFKYFGNKEYYNADMQAIQEDPDYLLSREGGLFMSKPGDIMNAEEEFLNSYVGQLPRITGIPQLVAASQRGYSGFLNKLRFDVFKAMKKLAISLGYPMFTVVKDSEGNSSIVTTNALHAITRYINNATGRGSLGKLEPLMNELNIALWSPRMITSRLTMLTNPKLYTDLPKGMRLDGLKSLLGIAAMGLIVDGLAVAAGAKVKDRILSADFMKSRFGNKVVDPWAGFQQYVVGAARFLSGKTDSSQPTNRLEIAGRFLANKESPAASLAHTLLTAKKFTGKSMDSTAGNFTDQYGNKTSIQSEVGKKFVPIVIQDIHDLATEQPNFSENIGLNTALGVASEFGMSQQYPEKKQGANTGPRAPVPHATRLR